MKNYDKSVKISYKRNWLYIPDHPYRILIIDGSISGKTNALLKLMKHQRPDIDKIYLYVKEQIWIKVLIAYQQERKSRHSLIIQRYLMMSMKMSNTIIHWRKEKC